MTFRLLPYLEKINPECADEPCLAYKALRIDGDGQTLKWQVGFADVKSCDYWFPAKSKPVLIECSDLKQQRALLKSTHDILSSKLDKRVAEERAALKALKKREPEKVIFQEMRDKCVQTQLIVIKVLESLGLKDRHGYTNNSIFIVAFCSKNKSDTVAFDMLNRQLSNHLKKAVGKVFVLPTSMLAKTLEHLK